MIVALATALAAPPPPMALEDQLAAAEVVALGEAIRVEFQSLEEGEERTMRGAYWVEYRVVEAVRGAEVGDVFRVRDNSFCMPSTTLIRRQGGAVYPLVAAEGAAPGDPPVLGDEALDPADWLGGDTPRRAWLMLKAPYEGVHHPVQFTHREASPQARELRQLIDTAR